MTGSILWYLHDQGAGHLARARAVIPRLRSPVVVAAGPGIATAAARHLDVPVVALPSDVPTVPTPTTGPWHHAPAAPEQRSRGAAVAAAVADHRCTTAVVDVSMEVTVLARLLGLGVVTVRQSGRRQDPAHRIGLASADTVWVPQHRALEPLDGEEVDDRWCFTGAFSRYDDPCPPRATPTTTGTRTVVLLVGTGGTGFDAGTWRRACAPPGWRVLIVNAGERWCGHGVASLGAVEQLGPVLAGADVVVASGGWGAVADCVATGARLALVPEQRPFDEQVTRAHVLAAAGLALDLGQWPAPARLGSVLDACLHLDPTAWARYYDGRGACRAATLIDQVHAR